MNDLNVKVGDKVILCNHWGYTSSVGTVIKITEKRKDIIVDYGRYKETYSSDGWRKSTLYNTSFIKVLTPEVEEQLRKAATIRKCRDRFEKKKDLTFEQAEKILKIIEAEGLEK